MDERIPCKNPQCSHFILPATAARTEGYCMPCVQARYRQKQEEYIRKNRKTIDAFSGITNPVEMLKLVHEPREHDPLIEWIPCPIPTDELYKKLSDDESRDMVDYAEKLFDSGWQEEAQEIALCLAAFTQANLDNFLRQVINEEELELSSPLPFHRAPPDVRDALLQKVETDDENRDAFFVPWPGLAMRLSLSILTAGARNHLRGVLHFISSLIAMLTRRDGSSLKMAAGAIFTLRNVPIW